MSRNLWNYKISWSCFDDKRFVLDNWVHTLAYFDEDCKKKDCNNKKRSAITKKMCDNNDN